MFYALLVFVNFLNAYFDLALSLITCFICNIQFNFRTFLCFAKDVQNFSFLSLPLKKIIFKPFFNVRRARTSQSIFSAEEKNLAINWRKIQDKEKKTKRETFSSSSFAYQSTIFINTNSDIWPGKWNPNHWTSVAKNPDKGNYFPDFPCFYVFELAKIRPIFSFFSVAANFKGFRVLYLEHVHVGKPL